VTLALRAAGAGDFEAILALNAESVRFLSPLDAARLAALDREAALHLVACDAGAVVAFLLAFREGADYDSENYRWFAARFRRFLYVDRVVVSAARQAGGLGTQLYAALFAGARAAGVATIVCEIDVEPPNPTSQRFHARLGFREVGTQRVAGGAKRVSMQALELA
jgi:predicted GNAT superfamily acetyltransferase